MSDIVGSMVELTFWEGFQRLTMAGKVVSSDDWYINLQTDTGEKSILITAIVEMKRVV